MELWNTYCFSARNTDTNTNKNKTGNTDTDYEHKNLKKQELPSES